MHYVSPEQHTDIMYGRVKMTPLVEELVSTPEMQRLKNISQDVLPQSCIPYPVTSRFEHCLGVYYLSRLVIKSGLNCFSKRNENLLSVASLLHDAGNPALSHLSEPFLEQLTGKNGESFLWERLSRTKADLILNRHGFDLKEIVQFVTGQAQPFSTVLNGSMDIDNLDNVGRYWFVSHKGRRRFDARLIASSFRYSDHRWHLPYKCFEAAEKWQEARRAVYRMIYGNPHLNIAMMVYRALGLAFFAKEIKEQFFHLDDEEALAHLLFCNSECASIVRQVMAGVWHKEIVSKQTTEPSEKLLDVLKHWNCRLLLADYICEKCQLPKSAICVYIGEGRDNRKITLPFSTQKGFKYLDGDTAPIFRLKVYVAPEFEEKKNCVRRVIRKLNLF
jgi:HD superfamily phosphohydrolase